MLRRRWRQPTRQFPGGLADKLRWARALHDKFSQMQDPVLALYGKARLAALLCGLDRPPGVKLFGEALNDLKVLPDDAFDNSGTPLPVSTFSAMWKLVVPAAQSCDPDSVGDVAPLDKRREVDRKPNLWLKKALDAPDLHRAAQLADAAISIGMVGVGPSQPHLRSPDLTLLVDVLTKLAATAPDLADALFQKAIDWPHITGYASEHELLAKYLFPAAPPVPLEIDPRFVFHELPMVPNLMQAPLRGNLDMAVAYLAASVRAVESLEATSADAPGAYTLAYQMLPKARLYAPEDVFAFENALPILEAQPGSYAAKNRANIGPPPPVVNPGSPMPDDDFLSAAKALSDIRAGRFAAARVVILDLGDTPVRRQIEALIDFAEAAESIPAKGAERVLDRPVYSDAGAKRALLYTAIASAADTRDGKLKALHMALKDTEPLPAAQRACLLAALASAAMPMAADEAVGIFEQSIDAHNGASGLSPAEARDTQGNSSSGGPEIRCGPAGLVEVVGTRRGPAEYPPPRTRRLHVHDRRAPRTGEGARLPSAAIGGAGTARSHTIGGSLGGFGRTAPH